MNANVPFRSIYPTPTAFLQACESANDVRVQKRLRLGFAPRPGFASSARIGGAMANVPIVFISSTSDDLKDHREQAASAARASGFFPLMMEYFPASGHAPSLQACREMVAQAEVVVVLVAHRYGWVSDDPSNRDAKSITWLECDHAWNVTGKEVLAFSGEGGIRFTPVAFSDSISG